MNFNVQELKRRCPMPELLRQLGLGEYAKKCVCSPFRKDKNPSWGIFERNGQWLYKDQATGESGDEISLIAKVRNLDSKRDFPEILQIYADIAGLSPIGVSQTPKTIKKVEERFRWDEMVCAVTENDLKKLASWRGYSIEFCEQLKRERAIGLHNSHWALPVHNETSEVIACHYRIEPAPEEKVVWYYYPAGNAVSPVLFGDPAKASNIFVFESPWDAFAVMDKLGWYQSKSIPDTAIIITRGSGNGRLAKPYLSPGKSAYFFKQNDETREDGKNAADEWLTAISTGLNCSGFLVRTPEQFKDLNAWTLKGGIAQEIFSAIQDAQPIISNSARFQEQPETAVKRHELQERATSWPNPIDRDAMIGVVSEFVGRLAPNTEADSAAILIQFLVAVGNMIGRTAHFLVEGKKQYCNMNAVLVGSSAKARKGVSWGRVEEVVNSVDPTWSRPAGGMSTGEGIISSVRDASEPGMDGEQDKGISDKRLLLVEEEFCRVLKCANREGNTLSAVFRQAFDSGNLRTLTKSNPLKATDAHISSIGHITKPELIRHLTQTEYGNGFANRILWVCVRRSQELPEGGNSHLLDFTDIEERLKAVIKFASNCGEVKRDEEARELWRKEYSRLSAAQPGLFGAVTSRAEAYVVRLSLMYAVLDCSDVIHRNHLEAALAVWRYCEDSARYIFGAALGDPKAEEILQALRVNPEGLTRTGIIEQVFQKHINRVELDRALNLLIEFNLAESKPEDTSGRPAERWFAK